MIRHHTPLGRISESIFSATRSQEGHTQTKMVAGRAHTQTKMAAFEKVSSRLLLSTYVVGTFPSTRRSAFSPSSSSTECCNGIRAER